MAVYTDVSAEALDALLVRYDIGEAVSFKGIAEGVENSNFLLQTNRGRFILTLYEKRVAAADLPFFLGLMEHLAARGIPAPLPVAMQGGSHAFELNRRPGAILTFLEGMSLRHPRPEHCEAAGEALAHLHLAGADFPLRRANALGPQSWRKLAMDSAGGADGVEPGLGAFLQSSRTRIVSHWPENLPAGIIHADLFPDNVLFMHDRVSGLIDFYFACTDFYAYDLAVMLNAWCFEQDGAFNLTKSKRLIGGYRRHRALGGDEAKALPLLCAGAALRFTLTRLYDWIHRDESALVRPKDPREFARRLRFHLAAKSAGDYGL